MVVSETVRFTLF